MQILRQLFGWNKAQHNRDVFEEVIDLRSSRERQIEQEAYRGVSLGREIDSLVDELVWIGQIDDFLAQEETGKFDDERRHIRAREIGVYLNEQGGMDLMQAAAYRVRARLGSIRALEICWGYIGEWRP